jgi:predicted transcriptional regulator
MEHHDRKLFEEELTTEVLSARVNAFSETKRRILDAIDFRIENIKEIYTLSDDFSDTTSDLIRKSRLNELETLRSHISGMVIEIDEQETNTLK